MKKSWGCTLLAIVILLLSALACGPVAPGHWDGTWTGTTIQEKHVDLVVAGDTVTQIEFSAVVKGDDWEVPTEQSLSVNASIGDDGSFHIYSQSEDWLVEVRGTFQEEGRVEGAIIVTYLPKMQWEPVTFVASREV